MRKITIMFPSGMDEMDAILCAKSVFDEEQCPYKSTIREPGIEYCAELEWADGSRGCAYKTKDGDVIRIFGKEELNED